MALFTIAVENDDIAAFIAELNATLATLTTHAILSFELFGTVIVWNRPPQWTVLINAQDGQPATTPFVAEALQADTLDGAVVLYDAFRTAHSLEFVAGPIADLAYNENIRTHGASHATLILGISNADAGAGSRWPQVSGGSGGTGGGTYTNATPVPVTIGGITAGSTFLNQTLQQMFDALLYPYQAPSFPSFSISGIPAILEVGDSIPAPVTFLWTTLNPANIVVNSLEIEDITLASVLATGLANDGTEAVVQAGAITNVVVASHVYRITGQNSNLAFFNRNVTYNWRWRAFYGTGVFQVPTEAQIEGLASNAFTTGIPGSYSYAAGGFKFLCVSDALGGQITSVKDAATLFDVPMATVAQDPAYSNIDGGGFSYALVSVTNGFGVTNNYRVYRTFNSLGGSITLLIT